MISDQKVSGNEEKDKRGKSRPVEEYHVPM
jgi:hypothetical protein